MNMACLAVAIITSNNWNLRDYMLLFCTLITFEAVSHLCEHVCCAFFIMLSVKTVLLRANAIGLACPQPFWGTLSGRFEPRAPRTVSLTVITGFTVGALSSFNIFISKNICVTVSALSGRNLHVFSAHSSFCFSVSRAPASQIIRKCPYRSVSIWKWRTQLHSWFVVFMSDWAIFFQTRFQPIDCYCLGQACISKPLRNTVW